MIWLAIAACVDYQLARSEMGVSSCASIDHFMLCDIPVTYDEAIGGCGLFGMPLVDPLDAEDPHAEQEFVADLGAAVLSSTVWWAGWPVDYACPIMSGDGSTTPESNCDALHPYICEEA